ncbi:branched-chain amino acid aminotransferase [Bacillus sp. MRMR6]|uniref:branched-chain amino acid aminotransferase n=1 Tax=Bacillus sp. MRMR6 TaxID=1928617 RepID=UPI0011152EC4|nr:branched-chain amino acid aminotransferase [Bacillus sp. MRMR6]
MNNFFEGAYIERCSKETENMIAQESSAFLNQPLSYLRDHKSEFIYLESTVFEQNGVDAVSLETDDVFGTYDVMLGLKLQKKYEPAIRDYLNSHLNGEEAKFDLMFSGDDGLWNLNFALNYVEGYSEALSLNESFNLINHFLTNLVSIVKK